MTTVETTGTFGTSPEQTLPIDKLDGASEGLMGRFAEAFGNDDDFKNALARQYFRSSGVIPPAVTFDKGGSSYSIRFQRWSQNGGDLQVEKTVSGIRESVRIQAPEISLSNGVIRRIGPS